MQREIKRVQPPLPYAAIKHQGELGGDGRGDKPRPGPGAVRVGTHMPDDVRASAEPFDCIPQANATGSGVTSCFERSNQLRSVPVENHGPM